MIVRSVWFYPSNYPYEVELEVGESIVGVTEEAGERKVIWFHIGREDT